MVLKKLTKDCRIREIVVSEKTAHIDSPRKVHVFILLRIWISSPDPNSEFDEISNFFVHYLVKFS